MTAPMTTPMTAAMAAIIRRVARKRGTARVLDRQEAAEVMGWILDDQVEPQALGAFCVAMRIKGETTEEFLGFIDAIGKRLNRIDGPADRPVIVIPSYNGARRMPVLTPLLGLLLAREGHPVLMHGARTESVRIDSGAVMQALGYPAGDMATVLHKGAIRFVDTEAFSAGLKRLINVRMATGLRNVGHSLVKMIAPVTSRSFVLSCYTHDEYADTMKEVLMAMRASGLLIHGVEGEPVVEARRLGEMQALAQGVPVPLPVMNTVADDQEEFGFDCASVSDTATYIETVLAGRAPVPAAIKAQVEVISRLLARG